MINGLQLKHLRKLLTMLSGIEEIDIYIYDAAGTVDKMTIQKMALKFLLLFLEVMKKEM